MTTGEGRKGPRAGFVVACCAALLTIALYLPALGNGFVNWDDNLYVYENTSIRSCNLTFLRTAFLGFHASGNWHPLTLMSHALDYAIWGMNPLGHHLTSVLLHGVNTFLVVIVVMRLAGALRRRGGGLDERGGLIAAGVTGLLFGIHPLHVESVAWVSERKDVLYALFYLLGILAYLRYAEERKEGGAWYRDRRYLLVVVLYVLSLMSKPMAVTFPAVLLLLDWYPLGSLRSGKIRHAVSDKIPLFLLSAVASVLTLFAQAAGKAVASLELIPVSSRLPVALRSFIMYMYKMLLPEPLLPLYTHPQQASLSSPEYLVPALLIALLAVASILLARRVRLLPAALAFYTISIIPVIGIIQVGSQAMADRYAYLPGTGLFLLAAAAAGAVAGRFWSAGERLQAKAALVLLAACSIVVFVSAAIRTERQISVWKNSFTLWDHQIRHDPENSRAYSGRGYYFFSNKLYAEALRDYNRAIELSPSPVPDYLNNRAYVYMALGRYDEALRDYNLAIDLSPEPDPDYLFNRAHVYMALGRYEEALRGMTDAITASRNPAYRYFNDRGIVYANLGRYQDALSDYDAALRLRPDLADTYFNRGNALVYLGRHADAVMDYSRAIQLSSIPNPDYFHNRAVAYEGAGRVREAAVDYQRAREVANADRQHR